MTKPRPDDRYLGLWGAIAFGAILASYSVFRPVRDALVLDGNPDNIPWLFTATFIAMSVVSPAWAAAIARFGRRKLVPRSFHVFAVCVIAFAVLVALEVSPVAVGRVFYVWSAVFNMFVVSVFWSLLADLVGPDRARKLYGPIAAGGTIGAIAGPAMTRALVGTIGVEGVLAVSAGLLELAVIAVVIVRRAGEAIEREPEAAADRPAGGGALDGLKELARSRYLMWIGLYVLCTATAATFMYFEQARYTKVAFTDRAERTEFFAMIDLGASLVAFAIQTLLAGALIRRLGPGIVLMALPLAQAFGITMFVLAPSLIALATIQITTRAATHGLTRPARELLFTVVDRDAKYRAKNVIDTMVYRFGDLGSAWLYLGVTALGDLTLLATTVPIVAGWLLLALSLGAEFRRRHPDRPTKEASP